MPAWQDNKFVDRQQRCVGSRNIMDRLHVTEPSTHRYDVALSN